MGGTIRKQLAQIVLPVLMLPLVWYVAYVNHTLRRVWPALAVLAALAAYQLFRSWQYRRHIGDLARVSELIDEAKRLRKTDPAAADRLIDAHFTSEQQREDAELAQLRQRAPFEVAAARQLRARLQDKLFLLEEAKRSFSKRPKAEPGLKELLQSFESDAEQTKRGLAEAESWLRQLRGSG